MKLPSISHAGWPKLGITSWWPQIGATWRPDLIAGLTVWGLVIPESIAYTGLAGIKPASGMWAIVLVLPFYVLFGSSKELIASPTAATAVTAGSLIVAAQPDNPANAMGVIAICSGALFLLAYFFKLGFIVQFISKPINAGFMFGLAVYLTISQSSKLFGIKGADGNALEKLWHIIVNIGDTNLMTLLLAAIALGILFGLPKIAPKIPAGLVTLVVTILLVTFFSLDTKYNVKTVGKIPTGFPSLIDPRGSFGDLWKLLVGSVGVVLLAFSEASAVASELAEERGHDYDPSNDMFAFGIGNVASGFVGGLVGAGSMSSSATNVSAGGRTPLSSLFVSFAALLTALFAGGLLANLPEATLGALIVHAIHSHLTLKFYGRIDRYSIGEARIALVAAVGVILFDVLWGLLIAMGASLIWFLYRTTQSRIVEVGASVHSQNLMVCSTNPDFRPLPAGTIGLRFQGSLFYGNVEDACRDVQADVDKALATAPKEHLVVKLDFEEQTFLDYTTILRLGRLLRSLGRQGCTVQLVSVHQDLRESIEADGGLPDHVSYVSSDNADPAPASG